jgi:hypothetical protein
MVRKNHQERGENKDGIGRKIPCKEAAARSPECRSGRTPSPRRRQGHAGAGSKRPPRWGSQLRCGFRSLLETRCGDGRGNVGRIPIRLVFYRSEPARCWEQPNFLRNPNMFGGSACVPSRSLVLFGFGPPRLRAAAVRTAQGQF